MHSYPISDKHCDYFTLTLRLEMMHIGKIAASSQLFHSICPNWYWECISELLIYLQNISNCFITNRTDRGCVWKKVTMSLLEHSERSTTGCINCTSFTTKSVEYALNCRWISLHDRLIFCKNASTFAGVKCRKYISDTSFTKSHFNGSLTFIQIDIYAACQNTICDKNILYAKYQI